MLKRILYSISQGVKYKSALKALLTSDYNVQKVIDINPEAQLKKGFKACILDFDGVLAPHAQKIQNEAVEAWLNQLTQKFQAEHVYILSNKPSQDRQDYFQEHYPGVKFIGQVRKKPYPDGILKVIEQESCLPEEVLMVDDRLLTGCLAALIAGVQPVYISKPYADFNVNPIRESFFAFLRWSERLLV